MNQISFVIPTFNRGYCIEKAICSIFNQSINSWELIIIDDGSSDDTGQVVTPYLNDKRVKYYCISHSGVSASRNYGANRATGDYLIFLDSDDIVYPGLVEAVFRSYSGNSLICWSVHKISQGKSTIWKPEKLDKLFKYKIASFLAGSFCISKSLFFTIGGYDENLSYGENYELGLRICQEIGEIQIIEKVFLKNNVRSNRINENRYSKLHSCLYQYKKHQKEIQKDNHFESKLNYLIAYHLENMGKLYFSRKFYIRSWLINKKNWKAFLKTGYLKFLK